MSVNAYPKIVSKENGIVSEISLDGTPESFNIYSLNELIFLDELKDSLISLSKDLDLSFFTEPNDIAYGNEKNVNISFTPSSVIENLKKIDLVFQNNENDFIRPFIYQGVFDSKGEKLRMVFSKNDNDEYTWGTINAKDDWARLQLFDEKSQTWAKTIDLTSETPQIYNCTFGSDNQKIKGDLIDWKLKRIRFYDLIKPEIDSIITTAEFANKNGLQLQLVHS